MAGRRKAFPDAGGPLLKVPQIDLARAGGPLETEIVRAVTEVLHSQHMILGPTVERFERELAAKLGARNTIGLRHGEVRLRPDVVGCASGSDALLLALLALGIGAGSASAKATADKDEVVTTPFTFFATAAAVVRAGAKVVFADIDPRTFNIDPAKLAAAITPRTKAVIPVHLYGLSADMEPILQTAKTRGIAVIEDAAQAVGATYRGRACGTMGDIGCLSFYPTKNLAAAGDAGALVTGDEHLAAELRSLRVHGSAPGKAYEHRRVGFNSRLDAVQAAVLSVKLARLDAWNAERRAIARAYTEGLAGIAGVQTPLVPEGCEHVFHQYVIRADRRDALQQHLAAALVETRVFYPLALHLQECFRSLGYREGDFPESERATREVLALPMFPGLTTPEIEHVVAGIRAFYVAQPHSGVGVSGVAQPPPLSRGSAREAGAVSSVSSQAGVPIVIGMPHQQQQSHPGAGVPHQPHRTKTKTGSRR